MTLSCTKTRFPIPPFPNGSTARSSNLPTFLRAALELLPLGIVIAATDGGIVMANREAERLFGSPSPEMIGRSVETLVPDALPPATAEHAGAALSTDATITATPRLLVGRRVDGSEIPLAASIIPLPLRGAPFVMVTFAETTRPMTVDAGEVVASRGLDTLVAELGAEFISLRAEELDRAIEDALGRVVRLLGVDRGVLFQLDEESGDFVNSHQWTRAGWAPPPPRVSARSRYPWHLSRIRAGDTVVVRDPADVAGEVDRESLRRAGTRAAVTLPVMIGGRVWGAVSFAAKREPRQWTTSLVSSLRMLCTVFGGALTRQHADRALRQAMSELAALRDRLREENRYLRDELRALAGAPTLVGNSPAFRRVLDQVRQAAPSALPVLLAGEAGTGKSLLAERIHELSPRAGRPLIRVNCAASAMTSIETAVFGAEKGAYAGADGRQVGRMEIADGSTMVFDEIADLPFDAQGRLLRMLDEGRVEAFGSGVPVPIDVRVIAITGVDLRQRIADGTFRDDLYHRLNGFPIHVPPLRERRDDIPLLVWRFVDEFSERYGKPIDALDKESMLELQQYSWWGNARELRNVVERAVIVSRDRHLRIPLPLDASGADGPSDVLDTIEKEHITSVLARCAWRIPGDAGAAARLGVTPRVLRGRIRRLGIQRPH